MRPRQWFSALFSKSMATVAGSKSVQAADGAPIPPPNEAIFQQKRQVRSGIRRRLREFTAGDREKEDTAIQDRILEAEWFKNSRRLCAYVSCSSLREVDTSRILDYILSRDSMKLYVPRVKDKESHMQMLHVKSRKDLVPNSMGILEPSLLDESGNPREDVMDSDKPVELLLLPGLGFDLAGRRLGRGGGYYDLFLQNLLNLSSKNGWRRPLLVALTYSPQVVESIPVDETDVPVDALVCASSGVVPISSYAQEHGLK